LAWITLTIDDRIINCSPGTSILQAARQERIKIPTLCDHPALEPFGACRLCLVEEKSGRLMAACVTPAAQGMVLRTDSNRVLEHRRNIVRLLMAEHPESCLVCNKGNRCELRGIAASLGIGEINLYPMPHPRSLEQANPFIVRDLSKCVLCGKCIRADHELVAVGAIDYNRRGFFSRPETVYERPLEESTCTFCGTCVSMCPTGALSVRNTRYVGTSEREAPSVCGFCGIGCSLLLGVAGNRVVEVNPGDGPDTVNGPTLCVRGHFGHDFLQAGDRLTVPRIRQNGDFSEASWDDALSMVSERLREIKERYGPQSVGFLGSSRCSNEENYLFQKIARAGIGTNNVDCVASFSPRAALRGMREFQNGQWEPGRLKNLEEADLVFVLGADPTHSSPVLGYHLKRASSKGKSLVVADPRRTELARVADCWLPVKPATDAALLTGIAALLSRGEGLDRTSFGPVSEGVRDFQSRLNSLDLAETFRVTGIEVDMLSDAVELMREKRPVFVVGRGILQQRECRKAMESLINLALFTGSAGPDDPWLYVPTYENNEAGAGDMGVSPDTLPGGKPLNVQEVRRFWERAWGVMLSPDRGLNVIRMIREAEKGNLKALYVMGENPLRNLPRQEYVRKALENLEFLVVQDILETGTTRLAHVVLPGAAFSEKAGSFTNMEGRIQRFEPAVPPPGNSRPDWEILDLLSRKMGNGAFSGSLEKLRREIAKLVTGYGDISSPDPEGWVRAERPRDADRPEKEEGEMKFFPIPEIGSGEQNEEFPVTVILRPFRGQVGSGTRTSRSERIQESGWAGEVEMSAEDSRVLGVREGDRVRVESPDGAIERTVKVERGLSPGLVAVPRGFAGNDVMNLLPLKDTSDPDFPGLITCPAKIWKVED
jgi:formate dehydrogenase alpha subunit